MVQACVAPALHHAMPVAEKPKELRTLQETNQGIWPRMSCQMFILEASFRALGKSESGNLQVALMSALDVWPSMLFMRELDGDGPRT